MSNEAQRTPKAFVLMPFDEEFDDIYNDLIKPALEEVGYDVERADDMLNQQNILKDIVRGIEEADLIIVDLTSLNANVLYELGISHTMQKSTVLIAQSIEEVPFDLRGYRVVSYSVRFNEAPKLKDALKQIGEKAKTGDLGFGNPVTDFSLGVEKERARSKEQALDEEVESETAEKGLWDFASGGEESMQIITESTKDMTIATQEISEKMKKRTEEAIRIRQGNAPGTASKMHKLTKTTAMDMLLYAKKLEKEQPKLHNAWEEFTENSSGLIQIAHIQNEEERESVINFRNSIDKIQISNKKTLEVMREYQKTITSLKGISRDVNRASDRIGSIFDLIIADYEVADSYCTKVITLLDEKTKKED